MSKLHVILRVKFRAFGVTFGTLSETWDVPLPLVVADDQRLIQFDQRGVRLEVFLRQAGDAGDDGTGA